MRPNLGFKIILVFLTSQFVLLAVLGFLYARRGVELLEEELVERGRSIAHYLAHASVEGVLRKDPDLLQTPVIGALIQRDVVGVRIEDLNGTALVDVGDTHDAPGVTLFEAVVQERKAHADAETELYLLGIEDWSKDVGRVQVYVSRKAIRAKMGELKLYILLLSLVGLAVTGTLGIWLIRLFVSGPVGALAEGVRRISGGDLDTRVVLRSNDELADLARAFNGMVRSLRRQITERVAMASRAAQRRNLVILGELSAMLLHEVGNTLNRFGVIRYRLSQETLSPQGEEALEEFERELGSLDRFTRNVSLFSRKPEVKLVPVDLAALVQTLVASMRLMDPKGVDFQVELPRGEGCTALLDEELVRHALLNLVKNAVDAVAPGGRVEVRLQEAGGNWEIRISDNGPGIPPDRLEDVFTPFFSTKGPEGTGLGLAIARSFIEAHGGRLTVESRPGRTTFTVRLPAHGLEGAAG
ncbi:HAMP domain-containing protein [Dissulfurirhabdus thermomarina]|uniref:histidine kinase n=1 Tax=Dissulfurirhabdus thermomarina TaxID=1765737 RepID=A0A6N9TXT0_DISTH|nr:HAMP domain-containing sensor histidine kinase [Dissulfurirhabdus thermomarina]NDY43286.1 HAMP domain-containing protein [Dissulfurirhabdus thermomarina]NMX24494.1 HAMP domain-containing protein [Dissulfurirhabdus thermomarina]